jgi:hypothetical protein
MFSEHSIVDKTLSTGEKSLPKNIAVQSDGGGICLTRSVMVICSPFNQSDQSEV